MVFAHCSSKLWNDLSSETRKIDNLTLFRIHLKKYLLSNQRNQN